MEQIKLENSLGFFLSSIATLGIGVMLLEMTKSTLISLYPFSFILVFFLSGLGVRSIAWRRSYKDLEGLWYLVSFIAVPVFGVVLLILFFLFASQQLILFSPSHYSGTTLLIYMAAVWTVYSLIEFKNIFTSFSGIFKKLIGIQLAAIIFMDASLIAIGSISSYVLPLAFFLLAVSTAVIGLSFLKAEAPKNSIKERKLVQ
ncbi:MAG: hypothetical protein M1573_00660 [Candidatus Parvarchaeota archaeon]|jgi:hypothetical protein|nr:hypothetical protein [Candidatus Parvarchaeota archaeon]